MIKASKFIFTVSFVLFGVSKYTEAADVSILDLNVRAHVTLNKDPKKNNGGGKKFVNHIMKHNYNYNYDFVTTQEGDDSTYKLTSSQLGTMENLYYKNPEARIYYKKADWELESKYNGKIKLTPDELIDGGTGERFASLSVFKSLKPDYTKGRYITIVSAHYCIDWWWADASGKHGSKGCASNTEPLTINIDDYITKAEQMAKSLGVNGLGKDFVVEKSVKKQIIAHVNDSVKIAKAIDEINVLIKHDQKTNNAIPSDSAVFFVGDFNNQYVSNPNEIDKDVKNPQKIELSAIEASAVQKALEAKGLTLTKFGVPPTFEGGPVIDFAYYSGLTLFSADIYKRNYTTDGDGQNTSDHDGMRLNYNFIK